MGQYFKAVNLDRREYVCPWCLGAGAKFHEWVANPQGAILAFLLRMSNECGGGDISRYHFMTQPFCSSMIRKTIPVALDRDEPNIPFRIDSVCGSWVGDRIALVGDYDTTELYDYARQFRNISEKLVAELNVFVDIPQQRLEFEECHSCGKR